MHLTIIGDVHGCLAELDDLLATPPGGVFWTELWQGPESVIYGHTVHDLEQPRVDAPHPGVAAYGIDTGCCFGGHLTAMIVSPRGTIPTMVQVPAHAVYAEYKPLEEQFHGFWEPC